MLDLNKSYLINELENNRKLDIIFLSHNAYWSYADQLEEYYKNCKVQAYGKGVAYITMSEMAQNKSLTDNCDLIISFAKEEYSDYELTELKWLAHKEAVSKNRNISIGYLYYQKEDNNIKYKVKLININKSKEKEITIDVNSTTPYDEITPLELIEMTLISHDNAYSKIEQMMIPNERLNIINNLSNKSCLSCTNGCCKVDYMEKIGLDEYGNLQGNKCLSWKNSELIGKSKVLRINDINKLK